MPYYSVIEGEGVAGPVTAVSAETTTLLSCMGIVFRNSATNVAGLYHYGAISIHHPFTQNTILQMINDIAPTDVYVTAPPIATHWGAMGSTMADRNAVDLFLLQHAVVGIGANLQWMPDRVWSNYRLVNGVFTVNHANGVGGGTRRSIEMATQSPNHLGRNMGGNTTFYGGRGPNAPARGHAVNDDVLPSTWRTTG